LDSILADPHFAQNVTLARETAPTASSLLLYELRLSRSLFSGWLDRLLLEFRIRPQDHTAARRAVSDLLHAELSSCFRSEVLLANQYNHSPLADALFRAGARDPEIRAAGKTDAAARQPSPADRAADFGILVAQILVPSGED